MINSAIEVTGRLVENPAGIARYIENLYLNLLKENITISPYVYLPRKKFSQRLSGFIDANNISWHYGFLHNNKSKDKIDISHTTDTKFLRIPGTKKIATLHDLAIFKKELMKIPGYTTTGFREKIKQFLEIISKHTDGIIAVSEQTKYDFLELFPHYKSENIKVIYLASTLPENPSVNENEVLNKFNLKSKSYFIFSGAVSVRKNLINIIKAFRISQLYKDYKFIIAGFPSMGIEEINQEIENNNLENNIILTGYVADEILSVLYANSAGLFFPTYYEGFGLSIIEAMQFKIPVLAGNTGSAPEIVKDFGILVSPFSADEIADGMKNLINIPQDKINSAYEYSKTFTWQKTASETKQFYLEILK